MDYLIKIFTVILLSFVFFPAYGSSAPNDSIRYEILMNKELLDNVKITNNLNGSLEFTSKQQVLFSSMTHFYLMGWGNIVPFGNQARFVIGSFAFTPDSVLMIVAGNELCYMDSLGNLSNMFRLPNQGMGISSGKYVMYLYDRLSSRKKYALYVLQPGGKYVKLLEFPKPIYSVVESEDKIFFSTENSVFRFNLATKELRLMASLSSGELIKSVAIEPSAGRIFFSTENKVYSIKDSVLILIADKLGGTIKYHDGLIIFDPLKKLILRMVGSDKSLVAVKVNEPNTITSDSSSTEAILTNKDILELVKNSVSDELILTIINHAQVNFDIGVDSLINLSEKKVSSRVIMAMRHAMMDQNKSK